MQVQLLLSEARLLDAPGNAIDPSWLNVILAIMADITDRQAICVRLNLTQEQLTERLGASFATVNRWEGGVTMPQRAARLAIVALATEAGVDPAELAISKTESASGITH